MIEDLKICDIVQGSKEKKKKKVKKRKTSVSC